MDRRPFREAVRLAGGFASGRGLDKEENIPLVIVVVAILVVVVSVTVIDIVVIVDVSAYSSSRLES